MSLAQVTWRRAAREAALGERDREAALGDVVGARERARARTASRTAACAATAPARSIPGQAVGQLLPAQLGQLGAAGEGANGPTSAIASPGAREAEPPGAPAVGQSPTMPITGVG